MTVLVFMQLVTCDSRSSLNQAAVDTGVCCSATLHRSSIIAAIMKRLGEDGRGPDAGGGPGDDNDDDGDSDASGLTSAGRQVRLSSTLNPDLA